MTGTQVISALGREGGEHSSRSSLVAKWVQGQPSLLCVQEDKTITTKHCKLHQERNIHKEREAVCAVTLDESIDAKPWNLSFGVTPKCLLDKWINLGNPGSSIRLVMVSSSQWFGDTGHTRAGSWELLSPCAQSDPCTKPHWCKAVLRDGDSETREVFKVLLDHNLH